MKSIFSVAIALVIVFWAISAHAITYSYTSLDYPGSTYTWAYGISGGNIVGESLTAGGFLYDGSTWTTLNYP